MLTILLTDLHHNLILSKWFWTRWMSLYFMISGTFSVVTVHQPPVLGATLDKNVTLQCELKLSDDEKMGMTPVLYWHRIKPGNEHPRLWSPSEEYEGRVALVDDSRKSANKSIILKNVQWADSAQYQCKLSIYTEKEKSFRRKGNETLLVVHDTMIFNLTSHNDSLLRCEVKVSHKPGMVLSIHHDGCTQKFVSSAAGDADGTLPYSTLVETVPLSGGGKYECHLHLNEHLIAKSSYDYYPPVNGKIRNGSETFQNTCLTIISNGGVVVFPEPWLLYIALLLVPTTFLLGLIIIFLMIRR
ncbi:uncharacterized protein LOC115045404 [Echeneis naucrates]|uniref:uncharacterized protein LOC115045404 n=1 Tax=Echeneis naucrates TaxID=173247 RepID=UPI001113949B|nr:uncharacterized protein LOC115045404 [Echeneis naucrates]